MDNTYHNGGQSVLSKVVSSRKSFLIKGGAGIAVIILDIILIALACSFLNAPYYYGFLPFMNFVFCLPPAVASAAWQIAEFITIAVRKDRGVHPGAHVGVHLVLWLAFVLALLRASFSAANLDISRRTGSDYYGTTRLSYDHLQVVDNAYAFQVASLVFVLLLLIAHFALFVRACIETHRRNKQVAGAVVYVKAGQNDRWGGNQA